MALVTVGTTILPQSRGLFLWSWKRAFGGHLRPDCTTVTLDERWALWFDGLTITNLESGDVVLGGLIVDQAALHGVLARIRDLGLPLIAVQPRASTVEQEP